MLGKVTHINPIKNVVLVQFASAEKQICLW